MNHTAEQGLVEAAIDAAALAGVAAVDARVVHTGSSVIVALGSAGPIARVGGITGGVRELDAHYTREVAVASWLSQAGAPVVRPWDPPGPFVIGEHVVSLWTRAVTEPVADPAQAGLGLRRCHQALRTYTGQLPAVSGLIAEARRIVGCVDLVDSDQEIFSQALVYADRVLTKHRLPEQPLHGDAGMGNVLAEGVWHDWEDACRGPLVWDLASVVSTARITRRTPARAEAMLHAYGDAPGLDRLDQFVAARGVQVLAWSLLGSAQEGQVRASTAARLNWLRQRNWAA